MGYIHIIFYELKYSENTNLLINTINICKIFLSATINIAIVTMQYALRIFKYICVHIYNIYICFIMYNRLSLYVII